MTIISPLPSTLPNGTPNDATQVQANFARIVSNVTAGAAASGANSSITSLTANQPAVLTSAAGTYTLELGAEL